MSCQKCTGQQNPVQTSTDFDTRAEAHLIKEFRADHFAPAYTEAQGSARVAQVCSVQHQLQQHVAVLPHRQVGLLAVTLAECIQQPHVLRHVCRQDCIYYQPPRLQTRHTPLGDVLLQ